MITCYRFNQLKAGSVPISEEEKKEFERNLQHERSSQAAFRAVATKRKKYKLWPTRPRKNTLTNGAGI